MQHTHGYIHVSVFFFFFLEKAALEEFDAQILQPLKNYMIDSVNVEKPHSTQQRHMEIPNTLS